MSPAKEPTQSRSEMLRQRRNQERKGQARKPLTDSRAASSTPVVRPVTVRASGLGMVVRTPTQTKTRRQVYVPLSKDGAEMKLPALPVLRPGWRLVSGILTAVIGFALLWMWNSGDFTLNSVEINGLKRISAADASTVLGLQGKTIFEINPQALSDKLSASYPELDKVNVDVSMPANVVIDVHERQPVLVWKMEKETLLIDSDGIVMPSRGEAALPVVQANTYPLMVPIESLENLLYTPTPTPTPVPVNPAGDGKIPVQTQPIKPQAPTQRVDPKLMDAVVTLNKKLPKNTPILFNAGSGLGWVDDKGTQVFIGKTLDQIDARFAVYQALADRLSQQKVKPSLISVEQINAPYYRVER